MGRPRSSQHARNLSVLSPHTVFRGAHGSSACHCRRDAEHHTRGRVCSPEFRSHRERVAPFSSPTGNAAVPFSAKWRASHIPSLKAPYDLQFHASLKLRFRDGVGAGTRVFSRDSSGGDMSVPRTSSILWTPGPIPTSLDALVHPMRDHFGLGGLIVSDESPHFCH